MKNLKNTIAILLISSSTVVNAQEKEQRPGSILNSEAKEFLTKADVFHKKINEQKSPQILDARTTEEFEQSHLLGAVKTDPTDAGLEKILESINKDKPVFIYSIQTGRSSKVAALLKQKGHKELYVLAPGIAAWIGAGYPINTSFKNKNRVELHDFKQELSSQQYVLIDYSSDYCPPCKKVIPVLDSLNKREGNKIKTVKLQIEANPIIAKEYKITALPTVILYKNGLEVWKKIGVPSVNEINNAAN